MDDWKFLLEEDGSRVELYDLSEDPTEMNNVARQNPSVVSGLTKKLRNWRDSLPDRAD